CQRALSQSLLEVGMAQLRVSARRQRRFAANPLRTRTNQAQAERARLGVTAGSALLCGATLEFFLDPRSGKRRRRLVVDQTRGAVRRRKRALARQAQYEAGRATGLA